MHLLDFHVGAETDTLTTILLGKKSCIKEHTWTAVRKRFVQGNGKAGFARQGRVGIKSVAAVGGISVKVPAPQAIGEVKVERLPHGRAQGVRVLLSAARDLGQALLLCRAIV